MYCVPTLKAICFCVSVGKKAIPVLKEFLVQHNSAEVTVNSDEKQIAQLMEPLGLHHKRAQILMQFSSKSFVSEFQVSWSPYTRNMLVLVCSFS